MINCFSGGESGEDPMKKWVAKNKIFSEIKWYKIFLKTIFLRIEFVGFKIEVHVNLSSHFSFNYKISQ